MKTILKVLFIVCLGTLILGLNTAEATTAIPVKGTITSFSEVCADGACLVTMEIDHSVVVVDTLPWEDFTSHNGSTHWTGSGTWNFGEGNTITETSSGVWGNKSRIEGDPEVGNVEINYRITGGTGIFENARGSIHLQLFQAGYDEAEGWVHGVIRLP